MGCDPAAVIRELVAAGTEVRVNIVGFAIDELMLQETFAEWARLGNARYFNAADGEELTARLRESVEQPFSVVAADGRIVASGTVNGPPISVAAGSYRVVLPGGMATSTRRVAREACSYSAFRYLSRKAT